jgi:hypothetical protein
MTTATKNESRVIETKTLGFRNVLNTPWPREAYLSRERWYGKTTYKVDVVCNGINDRFREFKTKREAKAYYDSLGEGV